MQNNAFAAADETLRQDRLREEKLREKLERIRQNLMQKISGKDKKIAHKDLEDKHTAALKDLKVIAEIKKSVDALKQNINKNE